MALNYKRITTVDEISQLSAGATVFVNDVGKLRQAKLALLTGAAGGPGLTADGKFIVIDNDVIKVVGFEAAVAGTTPRKTADGSVEWVAINPSASLEGSDEVVITDGKLGIGEIDVVKLVQSTGTELVFDAGTSA